MIKLLPHQKRAVDILKWYFTENEGIKAPKNKFLPDDFYRRLKAAGIKDINVATGRTVALAITYLEITLKNPERDIYPTEIQNCFRPKSYFDIRQLLRVIEAIYHSHFEELFKKKKLRLIIKLTDNSIKATKN